MMLTALRVGYIPLVDCAPLVVAAEHGFAEKEGLALDLVREVSWSNVRDKLNLGLFDAAHMLAPVAIASSLGLGHVRVPMQVPLTLSLNGNAITLSPALYDEIARVAQGELSDPNVSACALATVVRSRASAGSEPLTLGMTFPYSSHNYLLRDWMAAGGLDPDEDVRLVVLPPPYMVQSLASGHVDGFCVGAPWNSVAAAQGVGRILHFGADLVDRCAEKVLAVSPRLASRDLDIMVRLTRATLRAMAFIADQANHASIAALLAKPQWLDCDANLIEQTLDGALKFDHSGAVKNHSTYLVINSAAARPEHLLAAWLYGQMVRWGQAEWSEAGLRAAQSVFRCDIFDDACAGVPGLADVPQLSGAITSFRGDTFDATNAAAHLAAWGRRWTA